jgi:hypothetical protein
LKQGCRIGRAGEGRVPGLALLGDPRLVIEHGQQTLFTAAGHGCQRGAHEASAADTEPSATHLKAGVAGQLESFDLEAGGFELGHDLPSPYPTRNHTTHVVWGNAPRVAGSAAS